MKTMKKTLLGSILGLLAAFAVGVWTPAVQAEEYTAAQKQQIEELKKTYPLKACPVSGEKLDGDMGPAIDYLYTAKGADGKEATRLVRFCCPSCLRKFKKNPEPTLKVLDEAGKTAPAPAGTGPSGGAVPTAK